MTIPTQALSGRPPWSEIKNSHLIIIKLYEECLPQRPESLHILDAHWDFIMLCMNLVVESRPDASEVMRWIKEAISSCEFSSFRLGHTLILVLEITVDKSIISPSQPLYHRMILNNFLHWKYGSSVGAHVKWESMSIGPLNRLTWCSTVYSKHGCCTPDED